MRGCIRVMIWAWSLTAACGCAHHSPQAMAYTGLPVDRAQPRLRELLNFLANHGVEEAGDATVFELSHWLMYARSEWDEEPRKPRYEGAMLSYDGVRVIFAVSPLKHSLDNGEALTIVPSAEKGKTEARGATVIPARPSLVRGFLDAGAKPKASGRPHGPAEGICRAIRRHRADTPALRSVLKPGCRIGAAIAPLPATVWSVG